VRERWIWMIVHSVPILDGALDMALPVLFVRGPVLAAGLKMPEHADMRCGVVGQTFSLRTGFNRRRPERG